MKGFIELMPIDLAHKKKLPCSPSLDGRGLGGVGECRILEVISFTPSLTLPRQEGGDFIGMKNEKNLPLL